MTPYYTSERSIFYNGDCRSVMAEMEDNSFDSIVCDPPYGLEFMGKDWDSFPENPNFLRSPGEDGSNNSYGPRFGVRQHGDSNGVAKVSIRNHAFQKFCEEWATECLRVLKPGGHLLAFGGSRTYHRMASAVEDAGFEIRDQIMWVYGSGFPKSLSVYKAILPKIQSRYGESSCNCMDIGNGRTVREDVRHGGSSEVWAQRTSSIVPQEEVRDTDPSFHVGSDIDSLRELRKEYHETAEAPQTVEETVLRQGLCCGRAEDSGYRHAPLWSGVEESEGGNTRSGQSVAVLQENSERERKGSTCSSPEAFSIGRNQSTVESSGTVRLLPSQDRENNRTSFILDPNRSEPRRIISDDQCGRNSAVAHVCSWCGGPSKEWLDEISLLGTALKPAHEPIVVARKPLIGTVVANVLKYGTGALNIDACRIEGEAVPINRLENWSGFGQEKRPEYEQEINTSGRWPSNFIHDGSEEVLDLFPETGISSGGRAVNISKSSTIYGGGKGLGQDLSSEDVKGDPGFGDEGSAARYFYCAQYSEEEYKPNYKNNVFGEGMGGGFHPGFEDSGSAARFFYTAKASGEDRNEGVEKKNNHPTVKPTSLMRYLCRLVTPPGGTVLDPFMGSGSTYKAAYQEGLQFVGIELHEPYCAIAINRIAQNVFNFPLDKGAD